MTRLSTTDIDIHDLLYQRRQIAIIWSFHDVLQIHSDLTDDQAWAVLQKCRRQHSCELGITWARLAEIADELFPQLVDNEAMS